MQRLKIKEHSQEWHEWRATHINASDAPVIMGVSPYKTPYELFLEKKGKRKQPVNSSMERGKRLEEEARELYMLMSDNRVYPMCVQHEEHDFLGASLDGITFDNQVIVEIKCPSRSDHEMAIAKMVPEKYYPQIQHQLLVTGALVCHYFSYDGREGKIVEVYPDYKYQEKLLKECKAFYKNLVKDKPPKIAEKDFQLIENDPYLQMICEKYKTLKKHIADLQEEEKKLKQQLIEKADKNNYECNDVKVQKVKKSGTIDYSKIEVLKDVDLEQYRKESTFYYKITM